ncbi:MAG TPA: DEAD/DEAH box helicase [Candidatus Rifleibacterium sp.]|nr:DEAD/DEAH box helicase [Candidatus Rifleibacterium sp.]HPT45205.1 DEAD/DEAH box helicase [Candidatus Rifleibacterium sp.]
MTQESENEQLQHEAPGSFVEVLPPSAIQDFSAPLQEAIGRHGWKELMPVQAGVAPYLLANRDVIVQSRTGSGKTAAFLLPLCERLRDDISGCQALILVPTRELAQQVFSEFQLLTTEMPISAVPVYGGTSYKPQLDAFKNGTSVIIGTPGRLLDHLIRGSLNLRTLKYLIFDEADEMLSMGFYQDMVRIGEFLPARRCSAMFSATMPDSVKRLAVRFLKNPEFLTFSGDGVHVSEMDHLYYVVDPMQKDRALMRVIELEDPHNAIIFCNTRNEVEYVAAILKRFGYDADQISGDLSQNAREIVMAKLKAKTLRFLVATDIAARGIDISNLEYVIIYDMHKDTDQYIHRAGRTARAGNRGVAISLVNQIEAVDLKKFARRAGISLEERPLPTEEHVRARLSEKLAAHLEGGLRDASTAVKERMKRYHGLLSELTDHEHGQDMLLLLIDSFHQNLIRQGRGIEPEVFPKPVLQASPQRPESQPRSQGHRNSTGPGGPRGPRGPRRR